MNFAPTTKSATKSRVEDNQPARKRAPPDASNSRAKWLLAGTLLPACWLWMMIIHESGHVIVAWFTGARIIQVVLSPLAISRTDVGLPNVHPVAVIWGGPLIGALVPLSVDAWFHWAHWPGRHVTRFLAGFCLLANGLYVSVGSLEQVGDAGALLRHGTPPWVLWGFGLATAPAGLWLWNGLGTQFGFGADAEVVDRRVAWAVAILLLATIAVELLVFGTLPTGT